MFLFYHLQFIRNLHIHDLIWPLQWLLEETGKFWLFLFPAAGWVLLGNRLGGGEPCRRPLGSALRGLYPGGERKWSWPEGGVRLQHSYNRGSVIPVGNSEATVSGPSDFPWDGIRGQDFTCFCWPISGWGYPEKNLTLGEVTVFIRGNSQRGLMAEGIPSSWGVSYSVVKGAWVLHQSARNRGRHKLVCGQREGTKREKDEQ